MRRASGQPDGGAEPSENVVSFVRALTGLQVPPDVVLRAEELTDPGADIRRLLRCIMFLKNSEEVPWRSSSTCVCGSVATFDVDQQLKQVCNIVQACRLRHFPLRAMESNEPAAIVPVAVPMSLTADADPVDVGSAEDRTADADMQAIAEAAMDRRLSVQPTPLSDSSAAQPAPTLPEPIRTDSPTLPRGPAFREVTPLAVRAAVRETLTSASLQDPGLAPAAPSVRASADSTAAMAAILRQFTAHLRNQPAPSRCHSMLSIVPPAAAGCLESDARRRAATQAF